MDNDLFLFELFSLTFTESLFWNTLGLDTPRLWALWNTLSLISHK